MKFGEVVPSSERKLFKSIIPPACYHHSAHTYCMLTFTLPPACLPLHPHIFLAAGPFTDTLQPSILIAPPTLRNKMDTRTSLRRRPVSPRIRPPESCFSPRRGGPGSGLIRPYRVPQHRCHSRHWRQHFRRKC